MPAEGLGLGRAFDVFAATLRQDIKLGIVDYAGLISVGAQGQGDASDILCLLGDASPNHEAQRDSATVP